MLAIGSGDQSSYMDPSKTARAVLLFPSLAIVALPSGPLTRKGINYTCFLRNIYLVDNSKSLSIRGLYSHNVHIFNSVCLSVHNEPHCLSSHATPMDIRAMISTFYSPFCYCPFHQTAGLPLRLAPFLDCMEALRTDPVSRSNWF